MAYHTDYKSPVTEAMQVLEDSSIAEFPVRLSLVQQQYRNLFVIRPYSFLVESQKISFNECCEMLGSDDGASISNGACQYVIYYNEKKKKERIRFTIAHEMGHIFLNHHYAHAQAILKRAYPEDSFYKALENEANCFARNLLCPPQYTKHLLNAHGIFHGYDDSENWDYRKETCITKKLCTFFKAETLVEQAFHVSSSAAKTRIHFLLTDIHYFNDTHLEADTNTPIKYSSFWYCIPCGIEKTNSSICKLCEKKRLECCNIMNQRLVI